MAELDTKLRKWGDSLAIIVPRKVVKEENLRARDTVRIKIKKETNLVDVFGILKGKLKQSAQQLKDEARRGWE